MRKSLLRQNICAFLYIEMNWRCTFMILAQKEIDKSNPNETKLELYSLLGEGYKAMKEGREISIESLKDRISQRKKSMSKVMFTQPA